MMEAKRYSALFKILYCLSLQISFKENNRATAVSYGDYGRARQGAGGGWRGEREVGVGVVKKSEDRRESGDHKPTLSCWRRRLTSLEQQTFTDCWTLLVLYSRNDRLSITIVWRINNDKTLDTWPSLNDGLDLSIF